MASTYYYNGNEYVRRNYAEMEAGYWIASAASAAILSPLTLANKPLHKQVLKEQLNNDLYKDKFIKAFEKSNLKEQGVTLMHPEDIGDFVSSYAKGTNAAFVPKTRQVIINMDKSSFLGFHELGHAINQLKSPLLTKLNARFYGIGYAIAGWMGYLALFSRTKPKDAPKNFEDKIKDNCGKIAFAAMLPVVAEEALASHKGIKLAKSAGVGEAGIKTLKQLYRKALYTYAGRCVLGGLAVGASSMIMDYFSRPKKVKNNYDFYLNNGLNFR